MSRSEPSDVLGQAGIDLSAVDGWDAAQRERLVTALATWAVTEYARLQAEGSRFTFVDPRVTTATDAVVGATALLSAVQLEPFELAMWQGIGGI
jgi:hypothetical protein